MLFFCYRYFQSSIMSLSKVSTIFSEQMEEWLPVISEHKILLASAAFLTPIIWYSLKFWLWLRKSQKKWKQVTDNFPGPEKHWLYGNLHQVRVFCSLVGGLFGCWGLFIFQLYLITWRTDNRGLY